MKTLEFKIKILTSDQKLFNQLFTSTTSPIKIKEIVEELTKDTEVKKGIEIIKPSPSKKESFPKEDEKNINIISDGFYWRPVNKLGALWIPQQLWRFRNMSYGLWTVCLHHNEYSAQAVQKFARDIEAYAPAIISVDEVKRHFSIKECTVLDNLMGVFWHISLRLKEMLSIFVKLVKKY